MRSKLKNKKILRQHSTALDLAESKGTIKLLIKSIGINTKQQTNLCNVISEDYANENYYADIEFECEFGHDFEIEYNEESNKSKLLGCEKQYIE